MEHDAPVERGKQDALVPSEIDQALTKTGVGHSLTHEECVGCHYWLIIFVILGSHLVFRQQ